MYFRLFQFRSLGLGAGLEWNFLDSIVYIGYILFLFSISNN